MAWYLIFLFFISIIIYLFFAPFFFEINTIKGLYRLRFHRIASIELKVANSTLFAKIKLAGWMKEIDLLKTENKTAGKQIKKKMKIKNENTEISLKKIRAVLASFKVKILDVSIDTGEMQTNGILYPIFYLASRKTGRNIRINFTGENLIIIEIENSLARMSWAYISS